MTANHKLCSQETSLKSMEDLTHNPAFKSTLRNNNQGEELGQTDDVTRE